MELSDTDNVLELKPDTATDNAQPEQAAGKELRTELKQSTALSSDNMSLARTLKSALRLIKPYFTEWPERHKGLLLSACVVGIMGLQVAAKLWQTQWMGQLIDSFSMTPAALVDCLKEGALMLAANAATSGLRPYIAATLQIHWREAMVRHSNEALLKSKAYHRIEQAEEKSNFEQRLTADIDDFLTRTMTLSTSLLDCGLRAIMFGGLLYQISGPLYFSMMNQQWHIPGYMLMLAVGYAGAGIFLTDQVTKKLPSINNERQLYENDLRNAYFRLRTNTAAVAQLSGEKAEHSILTEKADKIFKVVREYNLVSLYLNLVASSHSLTGQVLPLIASSFQKYAGQITLGGMMQIAGAFTELVGALSWPINNLQEIAAWKPVTKRLQSSMESFAEACSDEDRPITVNETYQEGKPAIVNLEGLGLNPMSDTADALVKPFDMTLQLGQRVLVVDPTGERKSAIMQALNDIWENGKGSVNIQAEKEPLSLAQNIYFPPDNLRGIICYPSTKDTFTNEDIVKAMEDVGLSELIENLDDQKSGDDWISSLSEPQKRRINFARILLQKPQILFADNPAMGLDAKTASELFKYITKALPDTIMLTTAQDNNLAEFHNVLMEIKDGQMVPQQQVIAPVHPIKTIQPAPALRLAQPA